MNEIIKRLLSLILCVLASAASLSPIYPRPDCPEREEAIVEELEPTPERMDVRELWEAHPEEYAKIGEISDLALTAGMICPADASDQALSVVMYVIYNRCRTAGFPNSISEVCKQPNQWEYNNRDMHITPRLRKLAKDNLELWESGELCILPCNRGVLFFNATEHGLELMDRFGGEVIQTVGWKEVK